jgi:hypothetical protein
MLNADTVKAISDLAVTKDAWPIDTPDGGFAVPLPPGYNLHKVNALEPPLTHIKQSVTLHDRDSFIGYVNEFKRPISRIFAEPGFLSDKQVPAIIAVLDYHDARGEAVAADGVVESAPQPMRASHVAAYSPRYSDQWKRWTEACAEPLTQVEFAELIEECREDIREPLAAELLDIVRTFKVSKKTNYDSLVYQRDGSVKLDFSDQVDKSGSAVLLPEQLTLGIPVFYRGSLFAVPIFIRFKVSQGVQFSLKIDRADRFEDEAFIGGGEHRGLAGEIAEATGVPLHIGRLG